MVIVYVWKTNLFRLRLGHSSLQFDERYISFWPAQKRRINFNALGSVPSGWGKSYNDDCLWQESVADAKLELVDLDQYEIENLWQTYQDARYSLLEKNCCTVTIELLLAGAHLQDNLPMFSKLTPNHVLQTVNNYNLLRQLNNKPI